MRAPLLDRRRLGAVRLRRFLFQFPAPAGYGPQFVWLDSGVYRRAQGFFYEASTLGNFCAFFLVMIAVAFTRPRERIAASRAKALAAGGAVFFAALVLSYSRASLIDLVIALAVLMWLQPRPRALRAPGRYSAAVRGALVTWRSFRPSREMYWLRLSATAEYLFTATEGVLSGRVASWRTLLGWIAAHPWQTIFGIGYKTLPYTDYLGAPVVADNMYLSLLVETGIAGLAALIWLNVAILRAAGPRGAQPDPRRAFCGTWMLCFWAGESGADGLRRPADVLARAAGVFLVLALAVARMKLLLLDQFSDPGGAQQALLELLPAIRERGWRALVGLPGNGELFERVRDLGSRPSASSAALTRPADKSLTDMARFLGGTPRLAARSGRWPPIDADLVYINGPRLVPAVALAGLRAPVVFHSHSFIGPGPLRMAIGSALRRIDARVVGICEFVADPWRPYVARDRVTVIYNGVAVRPTCRAPRSGPRSAASAASPRRRVSSNSCRRPR